MYLSTHKYSQTLQKYCSILTILVYQNISQTVVSFRQLFDLMVFLWNNIGLNMILVDRAPRKIHTPPVTAWHADENVAVGLRYILPNGRVDTGLDGYSHFPVALIDGRRFPDGTLGMQRRYLKNLPTGTVASVNWIGRNVEPAEGSRALEESLERRLDQGERLVFVAQQGGEHVSPETTGGPPPDPQQMEKYGELDPQRDAVNVTLVEFAQRHTDTVIQHHTCRGMHVALNILTNKLLVPKDHGQDDHHGVIRHPKGAIFRMHPVREILDPDIKDSLRIKPPRIQEVNSAHSQGFLLKDIPPDGKAMQMLNDQNWYPWLASAIPGVPETEQTYEGFLRVAQDGNITGFMKQFHDERPDQPQGWRVRLFSRRVHNQHIS